MKAFLNIALTGIALAAAPLAAQETGDGQVDASEAMACSALYTLLASAVEDEPEFADLSAFAARWLVIASLRAGRKDAFPEEELLEWVNDLIEAIDSQADDQAREAFMEEAVDRCEANHKLIASEFDSIGIE